MMVRIRGKLVVAGNGRTGVPRGRGKLVAVRRRWRLAAARRMGKRMTMKMGRLVVARKTWRLMVVRCKIALVRRRKMRLVGRVMRSGGGRR